MSSGRSCICHNMSRSLSYISDNGQFFLCISSLCHLLIKRPPQREVCDGHFRGVKEKNNSCSLLIQFIYITSRMSPNVSLCLIMYHFVSKCLQTPYFLLFKTFCSKKSSAFPCNLFASPLLISISQQIVFQSSPIMYL